MTDAFDTLRGFVDGTIAVPLLLGYSAYTSAVHGRGDETTISLSALDGRASRRGTLGGAFDTHAAQTGISPSRCRRLAQLMLEARVHEIRPRPGPVNFSAHQVCFRIRADSGDTASRVDACAPAHQLADDAAIQRACIAFVELFLIDLDNPHTGFGNLATWSDLPFECDGATWLSVEHYVQTQRCANLPDVLQRIAAAPTGRQARRIGENARLTTGGRRRWKARGSVVLRRALSARFEGHRELRDQLLDTGDALLVVRDHQRYRNLPLTELMELRAVLRNNAAGHG